MSMAMMQYMPLRATLSFGGYVSEEQMIELLKQINS